MKVSVILFFSFCISISAKANELPAEKKKADSDIKNIYNNLGNQSISFEAFYLAYQGWLELKDSLNLKGDMIAIIDYSQPSDKKRFYLIDLENRNVIYQNYVAHGMNTGELLAQRFSNLPDSHQSSLGFFKTAETYYGKHGLSLKLDGLETNINHLARKRDIVIHAADYANEKFVDKYGRLGRSHGCPALPSENYTNVIEQLKDGTLLFIYYPQQEYLNISPVLN